MQKRVEALLSTGMNRSATFRQLVRRIEGSDVIVYVEARHDLRDGVGASMRFVTRSASDRFVRIQLNADYSNHTLVALLGHELQHVVEVADHAEVQSPDDLREFYRRTGRAHRVPTASTPRRRGMPATSCATRLSASPATCAWREAASLDETRLLEGSSFTADETAPPLRDATEAVPLRWRPVGSADRLNRRARHASSPASSTCVNAGVYIARMASTSDSRKPLTMSVPPGCTSAVSDGA